MPGRSSDSRPLQVVGLVAFVVAVVGSTYLGWEFDGSMDDPVPVALGIAFAAIAVGVFVYRRR